LYRSAIAIGLHLPVWLLLVALVVFLVSTAIYLYRELAANGAPFTFNSEAAKPAKPAKPVKPVEANSRGKCEIPGCCSAGKELPMDGVSQHLPYQPSSREGPAD
jgi:hypothetical protein